MAPSNRRKDEIGAAEKSVHREVGHEHPLFVALGIAIASGIALTFAGRIGPQLFDVSPHDPVVYAGVGASMLAVASAALVIPALRASQIDPARTLREE